MTTIPKISANTSKRKVAASATPSVSQTMMTQNIISGKMGEVKDTPSNIATDDEQRRRAAVTNQTVDAFTQTVNKAQNVGATNPQYAASYTPAAQANTFVVDKSMLGDSAMSGTTLSASQTKALQDQIAQIQQSNLDTKKSEQSAKPLTTRDTLQDWLTVTKNPDGTSTVSTYGIWDKLTGRTVGEGYTTNFTERATSGARLLSMMQGYQNAYDSMDSTDRVAYGALTFSNMLDALRGGEGENIMSANGISTIAKAISYGNHIGDQSFKQDAEQGLFLFNEVTQKLGYPMPMLNDGLAMYTMGSGIYNLINNWDKLTEAERGQLFLSTVSAGAEAYLPAKSLATTFMNYWNQTGVGTAQASAQAASATAASQAAATSATSSAATQAAWNQGANIATEQAATAGSQLASQQVANQAADVATDQAIEQGTQQAGSSVGLSTYLAGLAAFIDIGWNKNYGLFRGGNDLTSMARYDVDLLKRHVGSGTNDDRKALGARGMQIGAHVGAFWGTTGCAVGLAIGSIVGLGLGSFKVGKSVEQKARDKWRYQFATKGIVSETSNNNSYAVQLDDGQWYDVGHDGSSSKATMIDGTVKNFANPDRLSEKDARRVNNRSYLLPYEVDYTNDLDYASSVMLNPLIMAVGGSYNLNKSSELQQMLGHLTNGVTSNCGRDFTEGNFKTAAANIRKIFSTQGITNKAHLNDSIALAYFNGIISKKDYDLGMMSKNWIYDEDGFTQAAGVMNAARGSNIQASGAVDTSATQNNFATSDTRGIA